MLITATSFVVMLIMFTRLRGLETVEVPCYHEMYDFVDEVVGKHSIHSFNELPGMTLFLYDRKNIK